jgi:PAS domain S-box-containing protein
MSDPLSPDTLRKKAEQRLALESDKRSSSKPTEELLHELQVHQIELEMQNEEMRNAQLALELARDRYVDLYEFAPVGYLTLSHESLITSINLTGATMLGEERKKLLHRSFSRLIVAEHHDRWQALFSLAMGTTVKQTCELTLQHKDGRRIDVRLDSLRITTDDDLAELRIALTDVSEQKRLEHVLQDNNADLVRAKAVADKANLAKSDFISSMSHELRSPLNAILGFAQLLEAGNPIPTPSQKGRIDQIIQAGWYLLGLINEILDIAMIESGRHPMKLENLSLSEVLQDCRSMIEPQAKKKGLHIDFAKVDGQCFVHADRIRLKQILINLLTNAIKYNRPGGAVNVAVQTDIDGRVHIGVQDSGEGLSAENLKLLFQPFNRLGQQTGSEEGSGIGLVLSKRLVELMGGRIGVESIVGVGSVFWIEIHLSDSNNSAAGKDMLLAPVHDAVNAAIQAAFSAAPQPLPLAATPRTVLYVEDNPANMMLMEQILERRPGIKLLKAGNGTSGIALARIHIPEVILMDINLPGISGTQALRILRADPVTAHIPVIAISANAMQRDIDNGLAAGFMGYITKPIKVTEFMEVLETALRFTQQIHAAKHEGDSQP